MEGVGCFTLRVDRRNCKFCSLYSVLMRRLIGGIDRFGGRKLRYRENCYEQLTVFEGVCCVTVRFGKRK